MHEELQEQESAIGPRRAVPAWLMSLACHLLAVILGTLLVRGTGPAKGISEADRPAAIALVRREGGQTRYFADDERQAAVLAATASATATSAAGGGSGNDALPTAEPPPLLPNVSLPSLPGAVVGGEGLVAAPQPGASRGRPRILPGLDDAAIRAADAAIPREQLPTGPTAQMSLFGSAEAEGRSFVFVIDRSQSMGGSGLGAIQAAAEELHSQVKQLSPEQTFQVVAYNQSVAYFSGGGLVSADEQSQASLVRFVADLAAYGQTEHSRGLLAALRFKPEVIFLLTDGGDPALDSLQLRTIREQAAGRTSIHCLHFGRGPAPEGEHFLKKLAAECRGSYVYIDMNTR